MLLGSPVLAGESGGGFSGGADEGEVDDPLDAGLNRSVYGGRVYTHPIRRLAGRYHEEGAYTVQGLSHGLGILVGVLGELGSRKVGGTSGIPYDQPLSVSQSRQAGGDPPPNGAGGAADREHGLCEVCCHGPHETTTARDLHLHCLIHRSAWRDCPKRG